MSPALRRALSLAAAAALATVLVSCSSGERRRRATEEFLRLSPEEALAKGEAFLEKKNWEKARTHFSYAYESAPNGVTGRRGLLRLADSHFLQGGDDHYLEAYYKYRDFLNRYPGSEETEYVMYQIANCYHERSERSDRDQANTMEAQKQYRELLRLFPSTKYATEARERLRTATDRLAEHEWVVGRFYERRGERAAAVARWLYLLEKYPDYSQADKVYYSLARAYEKLGNAEESRRYFKKLAADFPASEWTRQAAPAR